MCFVEEKSQNNHKTTVVYGYCTIRTDSDILNLIHRLCLIPKMSQNESLLAVLLCVALLILAAAEHEHNTSRSLASSPSVYLPSIFLAGGQKCGSSSLFEILVQHPLLLKGTHKEKHFFNIEDAYAKGVEYYHTLFVPREREKMDPKAMFMDGTPMMDCTVCWQRIYDTYTKAGAIKQRDNLKFIVLLREPVSRDVSGYQVLYISHHVPYNTPYNTPYRHITLPTLSTLAIFIVLPPSLNSPSSTILAFTRLPSSRDSPSHTLPSPISYPPLPHLIPYPPPSHTLPSPISSPPLPHLIPSLSSHTLPIIPYPPYHLIPSLPHPCLPALPLSMAPVKSCFSHCLSPPPYHTLLSLSSHTLLTHPTNPLYHPSAWHP